MYFLIFCRDVSFVIDYFLNKKIIVRNKSKDIKGAIRISIISLESLNAVLDIIGEINTNSVQNI